jgi:hypothetical protein
MQLQLASIAILDELLYRLTCHISATPHLVCLSDDAARVQHMLVTAASFTSWCCTRSTMLPAARHSCGSTVAVVLSSSVCRYHDAAELV